MGEPASISAARWQRLDELLAAVLERQPSERLAYLRASCADDPQSIETIVSLLDLQSRTPAFLEGEAVGHALPFLPDVAQPAADVPAAGERLGAYRLLEQIGRGGMSVVYLAERDDQRFHKRVAVKVVQPLLAGPRFLGRFQDEREILARLEHPAIARLLDGGETARGTPYVVMEYVAGAPLDAYCDRRRLTIDDRLRLFLKVGEAVAFAHHNLVIHRDLKPGNVLVTEQGEVKLLDFGIAKVLSGPTDAASFTVTGERVMTPAYASPEQVRGEPVGVASDVYSLGVLLYELLTGQRPYRGGTLPHDVAKAILEQEPVRPSAAETLSGAARTQVAAASAGEARGTDARGLQRRLRGDLDTIVMKALRKEPARRYPSVDALLDDIRRHLTGRPVAARGDAWSYRLGKFARRHWPALAGAAVLLIAALGLAVFHTRRVERERDAAQREAAKAQAVTGFLVELFETSDPYVSPEVRADRLTARALLDRGAERIHRELGQQPEVRAKLLATLGRIHDRLGLFERARALHDEALTLRRRVLGDWHQDVAESVFGLAEVSHNQGDLARAEALHREAYAIRCRLFGTQSAEAAESLNAIGVVQAKRGDAAGAELSHRTALAIRRRVLGEDHPEVAQSLDNLAAVRQDRGDLVEAEALHRKGLAIRMRALGEEHPATATTLGNLGTLLLAKGDVDGAEAHFRRALEIDRKHFGDEHPMVVIDMTNLAAALDDKGDLDGAERLSREVLRVNRKLLGDEHPDIAIDLNNLGTVLRAKGDFDGAEALGRQALAMRRKLLGPTHPRVAQQLDNLGVIARLKGDLERSAALHREALATRRRALPEGHPDFAYGFLALGQTLLALGRAREAEPFLRDSLRIREKALPGTHFLVGLSKAGLGSCLRALGRYAEAGPLLNAGYETIVAAAPRKDRHSLRWVMEELAAFYEATGERDRAALYRGRLAAAAGRSPAAR